MRLRPNPKMAACLGVLLAGVGVSIWLLWPVGDEVTVQGERPRILVANQTNGLLAAISGRAVWLPWANCFVLQAGTDVTEKTDGFRSPIVWPPGTRGAMVDGTVAVTVPGFGVVRSGDSIEGGGGFSSRSGNFSDLPEVPDACHGAGSREYAFVEKLLG